MSFVRPAAAQALHQWREVLIGAGCIALAFWWMLGPGGILAWVGAVLGLGGGALVVIGVQRARFRTGAGGPGVVQVDEGRIAYFGPLTGGVVSLSEMTALHLDPSGKPAHWILYQAGQSAVTIPLTAEGADQLFDVFATLPGLRTGRLLSAMQRHGGRPVTVWENIPNRLH
ncbi:MAG: hypothetical protein NXH74_03430 [Rhodobacteraceae bacterium]|jgi:hypothetical protein|nr:hypothetical protein [Paracoccaceae bacterium]